MKAPTKQQIDAWKAKYGEIFCIEVEDKKAFLRKPDRKIMRMVTSIQGDAVQMNETLLNNCWLAGDEEIRKDDSYFFAASGQLQHILEVKEASLKKL